MTQTELILIATAHTQGREPLRIALALAELLTQARATQVATLRQWVTTYRAERQATLDGLDAAYTQQQVALTTELAAIDAVTL